MPFPFPCSSVIREWSWKKTLIEKKSWNKYIDFCCCILFYIYMFYNTYFIFPSFLYLLYSQFSLHFLVLSSFCIFRVYSSSILRGFLSFLNSQLLPYTYIFLYVFRFSISSIFSGFTIFSTFSSFLYFLYSYAFYMFYISNP